MSRLIIHEGSEASLEPLMLTLKVLSKFSSVLCRGGTQGEANENSYGKD